jgi:hypothetical protein
MLSVYLPNSLLISSGRKGDLHFGYSKLKLDKNDAILDVLSSSVFLLKNLIMFRVVINDEIPEYS